MQLFHAAVGSGAVDGRPAGSGSVPDTPERPLKVLPSLRPLRGLAPARFYGNLNDY